MFQKWKLMEYQARDLNTKKLLADSLQRDHLLHQTWKSWTEQLQLQRSTIQRIEGLAHQYLKLCLLRRWWSTWRRRNHRKQNEKKLEQKLAQLGERVCQRSALQTWKYYMVLVRSAKDSVSQANQIRKTNLLKLGWEGLSANVLRQRRQRSRNQKALHLHRHWFSLRSWMIWQRRCEASEDIKALGSVLKAGRHWKTLLCGKCLKSWKNYVILSKQRRIQWLSASRIYSTRVLTAYADTLLLLLCLLTAIRCLRKGVSVRGLITSKLNVWNRSMLG
jgi:hypothetical protein